MEVVSKEDGGTPAGLVGEPWGESNEGRRWQGASENCPQAAGWGVTQSFYSMSLFFYF